MTTRQICYIQLLVWILFSQLTLLAQKTSAGSGDWNTAATWTPSGVPAATDNVVIANGHNVRVNANVSCANLTINSGGTLRLDGNSLTVGGNWINNGTFTCQQQNNTSETITFTGTSATIGGSSVTSFSGLTINTSGTVTLTATSVNIGTGQFYPGKITLQNGFLDIGAGHALNQISQNGMTIDASGGGKFVSYGPSGWTFNNAMGFGNTLTVNGFVSFDNITPLTTYGNNGYVIQSNQAATATAGLHLNGYIQVSGSQSQNWKITSNAPVYGSQSTLYIDRQNQQFALASGGDLSWVAMASGTINVTPGYPNNVTLVNMGNSAGDAAGWYPSGNIALNGTLKVGDGAISGAVSLKNLSSFSSGGIVIENNSSLKGPNAGIPFTDKGNFELKGATTGVFTDNGATINFAGSGTIGSPQLINTTGTSVTFTSMTVSNGTYVQLQDPVNVTSTLTLTSGYVGTTATNVLSVNNNSTTAIVGGSTTAYVDGPLAWSIPATTTNSYVFPIGDLANGGAYLPLTLSPNSTTGATVTASAFNANSNGIPGPTVTTISTTEYWSVSTSSAFSSGPLVSVSRQTAVSPNNALATSSTSNGIYNAIGGTPSGTSINGGGIGTASPTFIVMVVAPLSVVKLSGKNFGCSGSVGALTLGGSGGTAPYTYSVDGSAFQSSGVFDPLSPGDHTVTVKDNTGAQYTTTMKVLGSVVINGNNQDVDICPGSPTTLTATNLQNTTPSYSWSTGATTASISVAPLVPTTYTVTSQLYNNNLMVNGSFESGSTLTGYTAGYTNYTGGQYATTPGNGGLYTISNAGINQCQYFSTTGVANQPSLTPQNGGQYFIADGNIASSMIFSQTISGLVVGTVYKFQYYYAAGDPDAVRAQIRTTVTGGTLGLVAPTASSDITTTNSTAWTQATYTVTATATSVTITLTNLTATGSTNGNDFFLDNLEFLSPCTVTSSINVTTSCTLPVEYAYFQVDKKNGGGLLSWGTASEENAAYFIIEKSQDGITFEPIGTVNAFGNSSSLLSYSYFDSELFSGITYYRIAQYDIDGSVHYSEIKSINNASGVEVQIIPNPNNGVFEISFAGLDGNNNRVAILNSLGQLVYAGEAISNASKTIDISGLASGVYYVQVYSGNETMVKKVIKE